MKSMSVMLQNSFSLSNLSCNVDNSNGGSLVAAVHNLDLQKKELLNKNSTKKIINTQKMNFGKHPMLRFYKKHNLASKLFLFYKETQVEISLNLCLGNQSVIAGVCIFDTIAASLSNILILASTCGSVWYKRKI